MRAEEFLDKGEERWAEEAAEGEAVGGGYADSTGPVFDDANWGEDGLFRWGEVEIGGVESGKNGWEGEDEFGAGLSGERGGGTVNVVGDDRAAAASIFARADGKQINLWSTRTVTCCSPILVILVFKCIGPLTLVAA